MTQAILSGPTETPASDELVLLNPSRRTVQLVTFALVALMFAPPIVLAFLAGTQPTRTILGTTIFAAMAAWLLRVAWRAPVELRLATTGAITVGRWRRVDRYASADVKTWSFAVPDGPTIRTAPATNALLMVALADGTRFRGETTADEGRRVVAWFDRHVSEDAQV